MIRQSRVTLAPLHPRHLGTSPRKKMVDIKVEEGFHEMDDMKVDEGFLLHLQQAAMRDGAGLGHLHAAPFHADTSQQGLSRRMCVIWMEGNLHAHALWRRL